MGLDFGWLRSISVVMVAAALVVASCGDDDQQASGSHNGSPVVRPPERLVSSGTLTYGVAPTFPPFEYHKGTDLTGFDIDMIGRLAQYMGLETEPLELGVDGLIPALKGGRIDIINAALYIDPERKEQVDFVPYMRTGEALVVPAGNPKDVQNLPQDLSGLTVAVNKGAIGVQYMTDFNNKLKSLGMAPIELLVLPTNNDSILAVESGRADAFNISIPGAAFLDEEKPGKFDIATTFALGTTIGLAVRKGDEDTKRALTQALGVLVKKGNYKALLSKYHLPPEVNYFGPR